MVLGVKFKQENMLLTADLAAGAISLAADSILC